ncbi:MAG: CDP-alcohol phosphatidyltransferase family protein [Deltaproteobacteria bacterium]|nr:CDP-alcohol phosphatidyltransferase family protein [Deltaproteobacteria bacterium]
MFRWFARPLSFPVAWSALKLGLVPNHVTYASLVANCTALVLLGTGSRSAMSLGVVLALAALILDAADGNMARTSRRFSPLGEWLEGVGAYLLYAGFHLAGGTGAWLSVVRGDAVVSWPADPHVSGVLAVMGGVAAAAITLSVLIAIKFAATFPTVERGQVIARSGGGFYGMLFTIGRNLSFPSGLVLPLTLLGIVVNRYEMVLGAYAVMNVTALCIVLGRCYILGARAARAGRG